MPATDRNRFSADPLADLRAELEPILAGIDWPAWIARRDRENRERAFARLNASSQRDRIFAVMSMLTVT